MAWLRFSLRQLLTGVAVVAVLLGVMRACLRDPELPRELMPLFCLAAFFVVKVLILLALLGLVVVTRIFDSNEQLVKEERIGADGESEITGFKRAGQRAAVPSRRVSYSIGRVPVRVTAALWPDG